MRSTLGFGTGLLVAWAIIHLIEHTNVTWEQLWSVLLGFVIADVVWFIFKTVLISRIGYSRLPRWLH